MWHVACRYIDMCSGDGIGITSDVMSYVLYAISEPVLVSVCDVILVCYVCMYVQCTCALRHT